MRIVPIDEGARVRPRPDVLTQKLPEGEVVLLHMESEVYFGLDPVGARMWEVLAEEGETEVVVSRLTEEFDVGEERLRSDLKRLIDELINAGLIEVVF